ncbi:MAG: glycosyltransferase family 9 protein [Planctomycetes bacterium]|nr:glycosyltransferase family 9 protein [Planctomycetota bacterium]
MRLLLVRLSAIGDVLHALPALEVLRRAAPAAELTWVVEPTAAPLLEGHPALDRLVVLDRPGVQAGPRRLGALRQAAGALAALRGLRADAALDLQGLLRSALVARAAGAARVLGPVWAREGAAHLYTDRLGLPRPGEAHVVERHARAARAALAALGLGADDGPVPRARLGLTLPSRVERRVVLLPGAGKPANRPPPGLLARVADRLAGRAEVVLVGGPRDAPRARAIVERCATARPVDLTARHGLAATAAVLAGAAVVVGGDTGPLHLARVLGRPVVGLFHAADPARTGPAGLPGDAPVHVLRGQADCAPCCAARCRRPDRRRVCLRPITADAVAARVVDALDYPGQSPASA